MSTSNLIHFKYLLLGIVFCFSCAEKKSNKLPYIGNHKITKSDTSYHTIPPFSFVNQDSKTISSQQLTDYIYVSDFFYTYCPTVCPIVISQMQRIYHKYENETKIKLVSFALDPKRDNVTRLKEFAQQLDVNDDQWYFLNGPKEQVWDLAEDYLVSVVADSLEPGGIAHSGKIILVDTEGHIRAFADGTNEAQVTELIENIAILLKE